MEWKHAKNQLMASIPLTKIARNGAVVLDEWFIKNHKTIVSSMEFHDRKINEEITYERKTKGAGTTATV